MGTLTATEIAEMKRVNDRQKALADHAKLAVRGIVQPVDDDPVGELDEISLALLAALTELSDQERAKAFNAAAHPRNPKGSPGAGRFRSMVDRLKDAITEHHKNGSKGDPFKGFDREQLRKVAKARGIELKRGEGRDSIAEKLLAHLDGDKSAQETPEPRKRKSAQPHKPAKGEDLLASPSLSRQLSRHVENDKDRYSDDSADSELAAIAAIQGFDGKPQVASKQEMDDLLTTGDYIEIWRGVEASHAVGGKTAAEIQEDMRSGDVPWYGYGIYGNGFYFSQQRSLAEGYSDRTAGSLARVLIPKSARIVAHGDLISARLEYDDSLRREGGGRDPLFHDDGHFAAAMGVDAIEAKGYNFDGSSAFIVLNRSMMIVEEG